MLTVLLTLKILYYKLVFQPILIIEIRNTYVRHIHGIKNSNFVKDCEDVVRKWCGKWCGLCCKKSKKKKRALKLPVRYRKSLRNGLEIYGVFTNSLFNNPFFYLIKPKT